MNETKTRNIFDQKSKTKRRKIKRINRVISNFSIFDDSKIKKRKNNKRD
jgi:hypothetical protein